MVLGVIQSPPPQIVTSKPASHCNLLLQHLNECKDMSQLKQIHALSLRSTLPNHPTTLFLYSRILHFSSLHDLNYAFRVFDHIDNPNSFMWNILIRACAQSQSVHLKREAILLYNTMLQRSSPFPDNHTFPFVLKACAYLFALFEGKQAHAHLLKLGFQSDFQQQFFEPDGYTIQSVINACAGLCALSLGMWAHAFLLRNCGVSVARDHVLVNNSLLDMYCKCGSLDIATQIFEGMQKHDVTSWNSMILGFAMHGKDVVIWRSLLDSCCKRNASVELSENIARQILESEQGDSSGVYVLLSRVYASASRWNDVGLVRKLMTNNGILKEPGCSLIESHCSAHARSVMPTRVTLVQLGTCRKGLNAAENVSSK
ncbi:hypothetical protein D5086_032129 [Populus alba]|uniref:Uncharacterized protein n=1 Tax=Populus alba TaxID=43335 RepID=A0ACC4AKH9_POPAL